MSSVASVPGPELDDAVVGGAADLLAGRRIAVVTGAGVSTDSGIPDYRGAGAPVRTPMTAQQFLLSLDARRRYWIGSHLGWERFAAAAPNPGHTALAELEESGLVTGVVTQNVDGLHLAAGSARVVELHGTMRRVGCTRCGQIFDRRDIAARMAAENPQIDLTHDVPLGPDGDVAPTFGTDLVVPDCSVCGGLLKPDVVFFGEVVPRQRFHEAEQVIAASDALVVAGSSLVVNSGVRLVDRARRRRLPIVVINRGRTGADARAQLKIEAGTSETLTAIARRLLGREERR